MPLEKQKFLLTNDVECHSFEDNDLHDEVAPRIEHEAMPKLLELLKRTGVRSTFFFTANLARLSPRTVHMVQDDGHEIACHGYDHRDYYDVLSLPEQIRLLTASKQILEDIAGTEVVSFRAPALRINHNTVRALEQTGFRFDSSVASQRFDGPLTSGAGNKIGWLTAPRTPYYLSYRDPFKRGDSAVLEVPVSAAIWPFIGTTMRLNPTITFAVQRLLMLESRLTNKPLVFLFHPNEALPFIRSQTRRRGTFFSDQIRHTLKMRNLGDPALKLLAKTCSLGNFEFLTVSEIGADAAKPGKPDKHLPERSCEARLVGRESKAKLERS